jgi:hypothetical protein
MGGGFYLDLLTLGLVQVTILVLGAEEDAQSQFLELKAVSRGASAC